MVPSVPSQIEEPPMSRTHQYRKVMKPLLERKRRARINKCLDDIKDLLIDSLQVSNCLMLLFHRILFVNLISANITDQQLIFSLLFF